MTLDEYRAQVDRAMKVRYGIDWQDACGDREPLERAMAEGETAEEFVRWFGEKYDLDPVDDPFLFSPDRPTPRRPMPVRNARFRVVPQRYQYEHMDDEAGPLVVDCDTEEDGSDDSPQFWAVRATHVVTGRSDDICRCEDRDYAVLLAELLNAHLNPVIR